MAGVCVHQCHYSGVWRWQESVYASVIIAVCDITRVSICDVVRVDAVAEFHD